MNVLSQLKLSVQRGLLGAVPGALRSVSCEVREEVIRLRFVFDGEIDEDDFEGMQIVGTEVNADFPSMNVLEEILRVDYPGDLAPHRLGIVVYERKERTTGGDPLFPGIR